MSEIIERIPGEDEVQFIARSHLEQMQIYSISVQVGIKGLTDRIIAMEEQANSQHEAVIAGLNMVADRHLSRHVDSMTVVQALANALNAQIAEISSLRGELDLLRQDLDALGKEE